MCFFIANSCQVVAIRVEHKPVICCAFFGKQLNTNILSCRLSGRHPPPAFEKEEGVWVYVTVLREHKKQHGALAEYVVSIGEGQEKVVPVWQPECPVPPTSFPGFPPTVARF